MPPKVAVLWYRPSMTRKVCWIFFGEYTSLHYPIVISNFVYPVLHKLLVLLVLLVLSFFTYPVERNCTFRRTVNLVDLISFQGFSRIIGCISCHAKGNQFQAWNDETLLGNQALAATMHCVTPDGCDTTVNAAATMPTPLASQKT